MTFKADRRHNPFPGRQRVRFRRKLLAKVYEDLERLESETMSQRTESAGRKRARADSMDRAETEQCRLEYQIQKEALALDAETSNQGSVSNGCVKELKGENGDASLFDRAQDIPSRDDLYFDDATGLIEVVGVPKPEISILDHISQVRTQVESMLEEWERFSSSGTMCFDPR